MTLDDAPAVRIPLNTLAIVFGLAGLADVWTFGVAALTLPVGISIALWMIAAVSWLWLIVAHTTRGAHSSETLRHQLRHPVQGPIGALAPIVGMLLAASLHPYFPTVSTVLVATFIAVTAVFAGWLISTWMTGTLVVESIHGGYFLPTVAGGLIAATTAAEVGLTSIAIGAFVAGVFFWAVMTTVILTRLMLHPALPDPLIPTLAIFVAPPAVAGTAWFLVDPVAGPIEFGLAALTVLMLLVQLALLPRYLTLGFSLGFWSFTFPFAAVAAYGIEWLTRLEPAGWQALVAAIIVAITMLVATVGFKSVRLFQHGHRRNAHPVGAQTPLSAPVPPEMIEVS